MLEAIQTRTPHGPPAPGPVPAPRAPRAPFAHMLRSIIRSEDIHFSAHASQRLEARAIRLDPAQEARLSEALDQAASKGARESLLLMDQVAYVVNVPRRTVITAVPVDEMAHNVFTNIDSAVLVNSDRAANENQPQQHGPAPAWGSPRAAER